MTMQERIQSWQSMAKHHSLPYYGIAVVIEPILLEKNLTVTKAHVMQTWLETPLRNLIKVTYKRAARFNGRRIEVRVNHGEPIYFGPSDSTSIKALLASL